MIEQQDDPHAGHCHYCREFIGLFATAQVETLSELEDVILAGLAYRKLRAEARL